MKRMFLDSEMEDLTMRMSCLSHDGVRVGIRAINQVPEDVITHGWPLDYSISAHCDKRLNHPVMIVWVDCLLPDEQWGQTFWFVSPEHEQLFNDAAIDFPMQIISIREMQTYELKLPEHSGIEVRILTDQVLIDDDLMSVDFDIQVCKKNL